MIESSSSDEQDCQQNKQRRIYNTIYSFIKIVSSGRFRINSLKITRTYFMLKREEKKYRKLQKYDFAFKTCPIKINKSHRLKIRIL